MRTTLTLLAASWLALAGAAEARGHSGGGHSSGGRSHSSSHSHSTRGYPSHSGSAYYTNVDGNRVHRPVHASSAPRGSTAHCADGTYSFSQHARGTCSHHGGIGD